MLITTLKYVRKPNLLCDAPRGQHFNHILMLKKIVDFEKLVRIERGFAFSNLEKLIEKLTSQPISQSDFCPSIWNIVPVLISFWKQNSLSTFLMQVTYNTSIHTYFIYSLTLVLSSILICKKLLYSCKIFLALSWL